MTARADDRKITRRQLGSIISEFRRLGLAHPTWREHRLDVTAAFTGRAGLESTKDLTMPEAGLLLNRLRRCRDCRDLAVIIAAHVVENARPDN